jgi:hypothetical protein
MAGFPISILSKAAAGAALTGLAAFAATDVADTYKLDQSGNYQPDIKFPSDLQSPGNNSFYMSFKFVKYIKRSIFDKSPIRDTQNTIRLPLPQNIKDNMNVSYNNAESLGVVVGAGLQQLVANKNNISDIGGVISTVTETIGAAAVGGVLQSAYNKSKQVGSAVSALSGLSLNPFQTMLFQGPQFKTHNFSWTFTPSNSKESDDLRTIIKTFQFHMLPGLLSSGPGTVFNYPEILHVSIWPNSDYTYDFKPCVVDSVNVDYAGSGTPSFFKSKDAPTTVKFSISLKEIEMWTKNDYINNLVTR